MQSENTVLANDASPTVLLRWLSSALLTKRFTACTSPRTTASAARRRANGNLLLTTARGCSAYKTLRRLLRSLRLVRGQGKLPFPPARWWSPYFLPWWDRLVARPQQRMLKDQHPLEIHRKSSQPARVSHR